MNRVPLLADGFGRGMKPGEASARLGAEGTRLSPDMGRREDFETGFARRGTAREGRGTLFEN
jgi:hypothetical protein